MYRKDNSLLISSTKSSVTLLNLDTHQDPSDDTHRRLTATAGPMPKDIRSLTRHLTIVQHKHIDSDYVVGQVTSRNNIVKVLACTSWRQQKESIYS